MLQHCDTLYSSVSRPRNACCLQPAFVFAGHQFDADPQLRLCKSMLLDLFRGRIVEGINLKVSTMHGVVPRVTSWDF